MWVYPFWALALLRTSAANSEKPWGSLEFNVRKDKQQRNLNFHRFFISSPHPIGYYPIPTIQSIYSTTLLNPSEMAFSNHATQIWGGNLRNLIHRNHARIEGVVDCTAHFHGNRIYRSRMHVLSSNHICVSMQQKIRYAEESKQKGDEQQTQQVEY